MTAAPKAHHAPGGGGHSTVAPGRSAMVWATLAIPSAGKTGNHKTAGASGGTIKHTSRPAAPGSEINGNSGVANTLAGSEYSVNRGSIASNTGRQATCALALTASASARVFGIRRSLSHWLTGPAATTMAAVDRTDIENPASRASHGSKTSSTITATARAEIARDLRPRRSPNSPTAPMTPARSTDGRGPVTTMKDRKSVVEGERATGRGWMV